MARAAVRVVRGQHFEPGEHGFRADMVYLTPTGRRCRWLAGHGDRQGWWLTFRYEDGTTREREFVMTPVTAQRLLRPLHPPRGVR